MYKVKWENKIGKPKNSLTGSQPKWAWAKRNGRICEFAKRQEAAQWIRNHRNFYGNFGGSVIVHPDGHSEEYKGEQEDTKEIVRKLLKKL